MFVPRNAHDVVRSVDHITGDVVVLLSLLDDMVIVVAETPSRFLSCFDELLQAPRWILGSDNIVKLILDPIRLRQCVGYLDEPPGVVMRKSFTDFIGRALPPLCNFAFTGRPFGRQLERLIRPCP